MKGMKIAGLATSLALTVLELLPFGIKMKWVDSGGMSSTSYHSYFESIPWGYGNVGPLICAILTIVTLTLILLSFFIESNRAFYLVLCILPWLALVGSLSSMIFNAYTILSGIISAGLLVLAELMQFIYSRKFMKE